jgi:hypothetical protein
MKTKIFFLAIVFVFPLILCTANSTRDVFKDEESTDRLFFMGSRNSRYEGEGNYTLLPPEELAFTGDDIRYFNLTTGEIVFNDSFVFDLWSIRYYIYNIYLNDKLLFENILLILPINSMVYNNLVFYFDTDKLYLNDGYPNWKNWNIHCEQCEEWQKIRDENTQKGKENWDIFIKYLSDAGKIAGNTAIAEPSATPGLNDVFIYPNPTTGELRIENGALKIQQISIFNLLGRNVLNTKQTTLDISHLPAGIYFVQIKTEKGVVTKKIVKN